jgi:hypothetical protein
MKHLTGYTPKKLAYLTGTLVLSLISLPVEAEQKPVANPKVLAAAQKAIAKTSGVNAKNGQKSSSTQSEFSQLFNAPANQSQATGNRKPARVAANSKGPQANPSDNDDYEGGTNLSNTSFSNGSSFGSPSELLAIRNSARMSAKESSKFSRDRVQEGEASPPEQAAEGE